MQNVYSKEELLNYFQIKELLNGLDVKIKRLIEIRTDKQILYGIYVNNMEYNSSKDEIEVAYEQQYDNDIYYLYMPFEYLYSEDWEAKAIKAHEDKKKQEKILKEQEEERKRKITEELEYKKYLELKKKFEAYEND